MTISIRETTSQDKEALTALYDRVLGPGRFARTTYRLREQKQTNSAFGLAAFNDANLIASVTVTPLSVGGKVGACLLGPLVVHPDFQKNKLGLTLMRDAGLEAENRGLTCILLIGDETYYNRAGYKGVSNAELEFPGPIAPNRILGLSLKEGALQKLAGKVEVIA